MATNIRKSLLGRADLSIPEIVFILEAFFGGFYVTITRSITPIFLVSIGFNLKDLLMINALGGLIALFLAIAVYYSPDTSINKYKLSLVLLIERISWLLIYPSIIFTGLIPVVYSLALATPLLSSVFINVYMLHVFEEQKYRRVVSLRWALSGVANVLAQILDIIVLAVMKDIVKFFYLYMIGFSIGLMSPVIVVFLPPSVTVKKDILRSEEEVEVKVSNTFLLLTMYLAGVNLVGIAWIPYLMNRLGAPDYFVAIIGFSQTLTGILASIFWARRSIKAYRIGMIMLGMMPMLIAFTTIPAFHLVYAVVLSFANIGANFYTSFAFAGLVKKMGSFRAGVLLPTSYYLALTIAGSLGYLFGENYFYVFGASTAFTLIGLSIALIALPELSVVKPAYSRLYSRILYYTSIFGYSVTLYSLVSTAKLVLKLVALSVALVILFLIYRLIYYITVLSE